MPRQITTYKNRAFTILELLIVVLIIGLTYSLVISNFTKKEEKVTTLLTLKEDLQKIKKTEYGDYLDLVCKGEECESCQIYIDNKPIDNKPEIFTSTPKVYEIDKNGYIDQKKYQDEICFVYQLFPNRSGSNMFVEYENQYYVFYPAIRKTAKFNNYEDGLREFDPKEIVPTENSRFYGD